MIGFSFTIAGVLAVIFAICWSPIPAWVFIGIAELALVATLYLFKTTNWKEPTNLEGHARAMFVRYGHFYCWPILCRDLSSSASTLQIAGALIGVISLVLGTWWAAVLAVINYFLMPLVAREFNPTLFLANESDLNLHMVLIEVVKKNSIENLRDLS